MAKNNTTITTVYACLRSRPSHGDHEFLAYCATREGAEDCAGPEGIVRECTRYTNVTFYAKSDTYGVVTQHCRELTVEHKPWAQYDRATQLTWIAPRQRNARRMVKSFDQSLAIVAGKAAAFDNFGTPRAFDGGTVSEGKFSACDGRWSSDMARFAAAQGEVLYAQDRTGAAV